MKIRNNGKKEFKITYNLKEHVIPVGDMEISDDDFANFILVKSAQWELDVEKIGDSNKDAVQVIEAIKPTEEKPKETKTKAKK